MDDVAEEARAWLAAGRSDPDVPKHRGISYFVVETGSTASRYDQRRPVEGDWTTTE